MAFGLVAFASLGLLSGIDNAAWTVAQRHRSDLVFVGHLRLLSLLVCLALALLVQGQQVLRLPSWASVRRKSVVLVMAGWLLGTSLVVLCGRVWTPPLGFGDRGDYFAFLCSGLLAEELLFRGTLQSLAARLMPEGTLLRPGPAIWLVSAFFALSHLQYHGFRPTARS